MQEHPKHDSVEGRRNFLAMCGKFAVVTPPAVSMLLASSSQAFAVAVSGKTKGNNGYGNGGNDGSPNGKQDKNR